MRFATLLMLLFADTGGPGATVPLRPLTMWAHAQQALKRAKYVWASVARYEATRARLKPIEEKYIAQWRAEGYIVVYHRNGWSVSLRKPQLAPPSPSGRGGSSRYGDT